LYIAKTAVFGPIEEQEKQLKAQEERLRKLEAILSSKTN
jgi:hypothetical protein